MLPTLKIGDNLLVNKYIYEVKNPFTGHILIPTVKPHHGDGQGSLYQQRCCINSCRILTEKGPQPVSRGSSSRKKERLEIGRFL